MDAIDSSIHVSTRSIVTDYFEWRLNQKNSPPNCLCSIVRQIGQDCEMTYRSQTRPLHFQCSSSMDLPALKYIHHQIASNLFANAEHLAEQEHLPVSLVIPSIIDWTTDYIDIELHTWLQKQNYWNGCLNMYEQMTPRPTSIGRYAGFLGTIGVLTALYMKRS